MKFITSKDNPRLKAVRALVRSKKERQERSCFVLEGARALDALLEGSALPHYTLQDVWISDNVSAEIPADYCIPHDVMEQLSDCRTSQGILGVVKYTPMPLAINPEQGNYLLLDRLTDPGNMGTLIRSVVAFGFDGVFLHGDCVEVFNPKTVRATMGALLFSNVWKVDDEIFQGLEKGGYELISTAMDGGTPLHTAAFGPKNVLVVGNEANGICSDLLKKASRRLSIPMVGNVESLNAAVAGSICMFAMQK